MSVYIKIKEAHLAPETTSLRVTIRPLSPFSSSPRRTTPSRPRQSPAEMSSLGTAASSPPARRRRLCLKSRRKRMRANLMAGLSSTLARSGQNQNRSSQVRIPSFRDAFPGQRRQTMRRRLLHREAELHRRNSLLQLRGPGSQERRGNHGYPGDDQGRKQAVI